MALYSWPCIAVHDVQPAVYPASSSHCIHMPTLISTRLVKDDRTKYEEQNNIKKCDAIIVLRGTNINSDWPLNEFANDATQNHSK